MIVTSKCKDQNGIFVKIKLMYMIYKGFSIYNNATWTAHYSIIKVNIV